MKAATRCDLKPAIIPIRWRPGVITGVARRRRWTAADKVLIVAESLVPGTNAVAVARRHGIHPHQLYDWRRALHRMPAAVGDGDNGMPAALVPIAVAADPPTVQLPMLNP